MLNIAKLVPEQASYYEQSVARGMDDYYAGRGEAPGQWLGHGASELALSGELVDGALQTILSMRHPETDAELRPVAQARQITVQGVDPATGETRDETKQLQPLGGYDCVFSTPKSLSVLEAVADPDTPEGRYGREAVRAAHEAGLEAAIGYLEERACRVRRGHAGVERVSASGFVGARFDHRTSRAQDPHRHSHVILANLAKADDGKWRALDGQAILAEHRLAAGYLYEAAVRAEMASRGFRFGPVRKGMAELEGMPAGVVREFSTRRQQVLEQMAALGVGGYYGASGAARSTRAPKATLTAVGMEELRGRWRARAEEHGFGQDELIELVREAIARAGLAVESPEPARLAEVLSGPEGLTERRNTFARPDVVIAAAAAHQQGARRERLEAFVDDYLEHDARVIGLAERRHTTRDLLAREREILAHAERRRGAGVGVLSPALVEQVIAQRATGGRPLTGEQADAVRAITGSGRGLELVRALAGSGKTHTMGALADCYRASGYDVVGVAPTARAARELGRVGIEARTLDALVLMLDRQGGFPTLSRPFERARPIVVINDEAGMNGTRMWARLLAHAERAGAKCVAVGDERQLQSVAAGGAFRALVEREGAHALRQVLRQTDPAHRRALSALREGRPQEYLRWQVGGGRLEVGSRDEVCAAAVAEWADAQADLPWGQAALVARSNELREELNLRARSEAAGRGWLGPERIEVGGREYRLGERVVARRNDRALDADNGDRGTVTGIDHGRGAIAVRTDDGRRLLFPPEYLAEGRLEHAYALTAHSAQGGTLERAFVVARPEEHAREWSYTAASRERTASRAFLIDEEPEWETERHGRAPTPLRGPLARYLEALGRSEAEPLAAEQAHARPFAPEWEQDAGLRPVRDLGAGAERERREGRPDGPEQGPSQGPRLGI